MGSGGRPYLRSKAAAAGSEVTLKAGVQPGSVQATQSKRVEKEGTYRVVARTHLPGLSLTFGVMCRHTCAQGGSSLQPRSFCKHRGATAASAHLAGARALVGGVAAHVLAINAHEARLPGERAVREELPRHALHVALRHHAARAVEVLRVRRRLPQHGHAVLCSVAYGGGHVRDELARQAARLQQAARELLRRSLRPLLVLHARDQVCQGVSANCGAPRGARGALAPPGTHLCGVRERGIAGELQERARKNEARARDSGVGEACGAAVFEAPEVGVCKGGVKVAKVNGVHVRQALGPQKQGGRRQRLRRC